MVLMAPVAAVVRLDRWWLGLHPILVWLELLQLVAAVELLPAMANHSPDCMVRPVLVAAPLLHLPPIEQL
jgi:hypothetical protein